MIGVGLGWWPSGATTASLVVGALLAVGCGSRGGGGDAAPVETDARDASAPEAGETQASSDAPAPDVGEAETGGDGRDTFDAAPDGGDVRDAAPDGGDGRDAAPDGGDGRDAAPDSGDARDGPPGDGSRMDAPPDGVGACSETRLLAETKAMVDGWTNRMRVCEPQQTSVYGQSGFTGDITRAACIGTECGGPGMCAVDFEWYAPVTVGRNSLGQLVANTSVHVAPRCTIRYTHGSENCLCRVDPTSTGVWMDRTWMASLTAASSGDPGPLTFTIRAVQVSGAVVTAYGPEVVMCEGSLIGTDGVDRCTLPPTSTNAVARTALGDCNTATSDWFIGLSDLFEAYVATYVGTCP